MGYGLRLLICGFQFRVECLYTGFQALVAGEGPVMPGTHVGRLFGEAFQFKPNTCPMLCTYYRALIIPNAMLWVPYCKYSIRPLYYVQSSMRSEMPVVTEL